MERRERAIADLQAAGAVFGQSGDVLALKRAIIAATDVQPWVFQPRSQCSGKRRYGSEAAARRMVKVIGDPGKDTYRCPHCRGWHNGHPPKGRP